MVSLYPAKIDTSLSLPTVTDNITAFDAIIVNRLRDAIINIETELGIKPSGIYTTVRDRFDAIEAGIIGVAFIAGGDLSGSSINQKVIGLQGHPISSQIPATNQILTWSGISWIPAAAPIGFSTGGDLSGTATNQLVIGLQGNPITNTNPSINQALVWNGGSWAGKTLSLTGDVGSVTIGTNTNVSVIALQGNSVSSSTPIVGETLVWNGNNWEPKDIEGPIYPLSYTRTGGAYAQNLNVTEGSSFRATLGASIGAVIYDPTTFSYGGPFIWYERQGSFDLVRFDFNNALYSVIPLNDINSGVVSNGINSSIIDNSGDAWVAAGGLQLAHVDGNAFRIKEIITTSFNIVNQGYDSTNNHIIVSYDTNLVAIFNITTKIFGSPIDIRTSGTERIITIFPAGGFVWITTENSFTFASKVYKCNLTNLAVIASVAIPGSPTVAIGLSYYDAGGKIFVADDATNNLYRIDITTMGLTSIVVTGAITISGTIIDPITPSVWIADRSSGIARQVLNPGGSLTLGTTITLSSDLRAEPFVGCWNPTNSVITISDLRLDQIYTFSPDGTELVVMPLLGITIPVPYPGWYDKTDIYIDPAIGNDTSTGDLGDPIQSPQEMIRRYGTDSPTLPFGQSLTIHFLSDEPAGTAWKFSPFLTNGGMCNIIGTLTPVTTGINGTVVTMNPSTATKCTVNLGQAATGHKGRIYHDITLDAWAFVDSDGTSGNVATLTQPLSDPTLANWYAVFTPTAIVPISGNSYEILVPSKCNCVLFDPISSSGLSNSFTMSSIANVELVPGTSTFSTFRVGSAIAMMNVICTTSAISAFTSSDVQSNITGSSAINCWFPNSSNYFCNMALVGGGIPSSCQFLAFDGNSSADGNCYLDVAQGGGGNINQRSGFLTLGLVEMQGLLRLGGGGDAPGHCLGFPLYFGSAKLWGTGSLQIIDQYVLEIFSITAVQFLAFSGSLLLNSVAFGFSETLASPSVRNWIALTPAALDATAGVSGFGGSATGKWGARIVSGG